MKLSKKVTQKWKDPRFKEFVLAFDLLNADRRQGYVTPNRKNLDELQDSLRKLFKQSDLTLVDLEAGNASAGILSTDDEKFVFRIPTLSPHSIAAFSQCEKLNTNNLPIVTNTKFLIIAESDASIFFPGTKDYQCFSITDYVRNGNLKTTSLREAKETSQNPDLLARYQLARSRVLNIAQILKVLLNNGIIFTDLKPANLLLRDDGKLVISDPKCFFQGKTGRLRKNESNRYLVDCTENRGFICSFSEQYAPAEFNPNNKNVDLEKFYCFQLGKILYELATLSFECEINDIGYKDAFFATPLGSLANQLLHGEINTLEDAVNELTALQNSDKIQQVQTSKIPSLTRLPSSSSDNAGPSAPRTRTQGGLFGIPRLDLTNVTGYGATTDDLVPPLLPRESHIETLIPLPDVNFNIADQGNPPEVDVKLGNKPK